MQIDWWTLGLQAVNFLVLVWLLQRFLFKPVRAVIRKRRKLAEQAFAEADRAKAAAAEESQRLTAARAELDREHQERVNRLHAEMSEEREKLLATAKQEAQAAMQDARAEIADERQRALRQLKDEIAATAADLAAALLRGLEAAAVDRAVLHKAEASLTALPEADLAGLRRDLSGDGNNVTVVTASGLDGALEDEWRAAAERWFGAAAAVEFAAEPAILGGVELRFPHAVLRFTWAEELRRAIAEMADDDAA